MTLAHLHVQDTLNKGDVAIVKAVQEIISSLSPGISFLDLPLDHLKSGNLETFTRINQTDGLVIGGGGIYYRYFLPFNDNFINQIKVPTAIFGVGYINEFGAPPLGSDEQSSIKALNDHSLFTSVRDNYTLNFLKDIGVTKPVTLTGDPAILLTESPPPKGPTGEVNIGLNINYSGWLDFGKYREKILTSYRYLASHLSASHHAKFYYLLHHPSELEILKDLTIPQLEVIDLPVNEQKGFYSQLDLVVGMMLHSAVLSFGALTPCLNIAYDQRNLSFADFIGYPELVIHPDDLNNEVLLARAQLILGNRKKYLGFIEKKAQIKANTEGFIKNFLATLKPNSPSV